MRDHYEVLGVNRSADAQEIKKAYRKLAHQYHPDKNPGDKTAEERFKEVTQAYDILSDTGKRQQYDRFGHQGAGASGPSSAQGFTENVGEVFSDIFGDFFGGKSRAGPKKGADRSYQLYVELEDIVLGKEHIVAVPKTEACGFCQTTGADPQTPAKSCPSCKGTGEIRLEQGLFSVKKRCQPCRGRGKIISKPCGHCQGNGYTQRQTQLKVKTPLGAEDGTILRYSGAGELSNDGGPPGDLHIVLHIKPHRLFKRQGQDLSLEVPIGALDAILGAEISLPTLQGHVRMKMPPGTQAGRIFRLRGKGIPSGKSDKATGDLLVTVRLETPVHLTDKQIALLKECQKDLQGHQLPAVQAFGQLVG